MARQWLIPGGTYTDEVDATRAYLIPSDAYVNESVAATTAGFGPLLAFYRNYHIRA